MHLHNAELYLLLDIDSTEAHLQNTLTDNVHFVNSLRCWRLGLEWTGFIHRVSYVKICVYFYAYIQIRIFPNFCLLRVTIHLSDLVLKSFFNHIYVIHLVQGCIRKVHPHNVKVHKHSILGIGMQLQHMCIVTLFVWIDAEHNAHIFKCPEYSTRQ